MPSQLRIKSTTERGALIEELKHAATFAKQYARRLNAVNVAVQNVISATKFINTPDRHPYHAEELHARLESASMELSGVVSAIKDELDDSWQIIRECTTYIAQCDGLEQVPIAPPVVISPTVKNVTKADKETFTKTVKTILDARDKLQELYIKYYADEKKPELIPMVQMSMATRSRDGIEMKPTVFNIEDAINEIMIKVAEKQLAEGQVAGLTQPPAGDHGHPGEGGGCCGD